MAGEYGARKLPMAGEEGADQPTVAAEAKPKTRSGEAGTRIVVEFEERESVCVFREIAVVSVR